ncbi:MAG: hypothetical protein ACK2UH_18490 [Candidatus Promineifilaceae bacterium]
MNRFPARYFKVVNHPQGRYSVWFADAPRQEPWQDTGQRGSETESWNYVEATESSQGYLFQFDRPG